MTRNVHLCASILFLLAAALSPTARAVPSYARALGAPCATCHTLFPQLNAFGRQFKLSGYTLGAAASSEQGKQGEAGDNSESLDALPALSVMLQAAYTSLQQPLPDNQNNSGQLPQEASLFFAGRIAPGLGSFVQLTYSQADGQIALDNAELRYARQGKLGNTPVSYGVVLNNNPTLEDLWSSTPVWGFPWAAPDVGPEPSASPLIEEALAQDVIGVGGYASFGGKLYAATTLYRSAHVGSNTPGPDSENTIDNAAIYWRVAWQFLKGSHSLEIGGYGLSANLVPHGVGGPTDGYDDVAVDFQYEQTIGMRNLVVHGSYVDENQNLTASSLAGTVGRSGYDLSLLKLDAGLYGSKLSYVLGHRQGHGDLDNLRFAAEPVTGSASGKPDSSAWIAEVIYSPWRNVQLRAQYTAYTQFNGASHNYDGFGRDASDNNTLFFNAWFVW